MNLKLIHQTVWVAILYFAFFQLASAPSVPAEAAPDIETMVMTCLSDFEALLVSI